MCGFFAILGPDPRRARHRIADAHKVQGHRGPDGQGDWEGVVARKHIALGHQRLAILDLSEAGHQPMVHQQTGSALVWNGELYNYLEPVDAQ